MGQSTDALIAFGFDLGAEEEMPDSLRELMEEGGCESDLVLALDAGIALPEYLACDDYKAYAAARLTALAPLKIDLIAHCSGDYTMYFLAARGSNKRAYRGGPQALDASELDATKFGPECIDAMRSFCDRHGIEWEEPKWHIFSMWL